MKVKILGCMAILSALLTASCANDLGHEVASDNGIGGDQVEVTFSVSTESSAMQTRADGGPGRWQSKIGKAQNIDMLVYAIYLVEEDKYTLLTQYGQGYINLKNEPVDGKNAGDGQTVVLDDNLFKANDYDANRTGEYKIKLRLMRNKDYRIAFWAQNSTCEAYTTTDLTKVQVDYSKAKNNDELRDAFCKVESFSVSATATAESRTVVLTRPMAQINVGTTGADIEINGNKALGSSTISTSQIIVTGVSNAINVVEDIIGTYYSGEDKVADGEVMKEGNKLKAVTFAWNSILAGQTGYSSPEEYLLVDLDYDGKIAGTDNGDSGYKTDYPTLDENGKPLTETFKYLSMCYVLVPASKLDSDSVKDPSYTEDTASGASAGDTTDSKPWNDDTNGEYTYTSTLLASVDVQFGSGNHSATSISLTNVPVHRNWRTNILGGLYDNTPKNDPEDPEEPGDDPSSIFNNVSVSVTTEPLFNGEYNSEDKGDNWTEGDYSGKYEDDPQQGTNGQ